MGLRIQQRPRRTLVGGEGRAVPLPASGGNLAAGGAVDGAQADHDIAHMGTGTFNHRTSVSVLAPDLAEGRPETPPHLSEEFEEEG